MTPIACLQQLQKSAPRQVLFVEADRQLDAQTLFARAASLAAQLQAQGIGPGSNVALYLPRGLDAVVAVYGNIDGTPIRSRYPGHQRQVREGLDIWMTHIGGYPGNYDSRVKPDIFEKSPGLFISGHSHILKVMPDKNFGFLHINPGAAGRNGLHKVRTLVRFEIDKGRIGNLDVIELGTRSRT